MNAESRSACTCIVGYERTTKLELRDQYLSSLQELILSKEFREDK